MSHETTLAEAIETIRAAAEQMDHDDRFKLNFEEYPKLNEDDLSEWEAWLQKQPGLGTYRIPNDIRMVYSVSGGFLFQWQYLAAKPHVVSGSAELVTILSLYQRDDEAGKPVSAIYDSPRPFDVISDDEYVGIEFSQEGKIVLVHIDDAEKTKVALALNPVQYLCSLAEYRAIYGWQALFVSEKKNSPANSQSLRNQVKQLFGNKGLIP